MASIHRAFVIGASGLVLACSSFAAEGNLTVAKYQFSTTWRDRAADGKIVETTGTSSLYRAADGRVRQEIASKTGHRVVELLGGKPRGAYVLDLDKKTYRRDSEVGFRTSPLGEHAKLSNDLGDKEIQSLTCHGYGGTDKKGEYIEIWQCPFPNSHTTFIGEIVQRKPDGSSHHFVLTKITPSMKLPAAMFDIPPAFRAVDTPKQNLP